MKKFLLFIMFIPSLVFAGGWTKTFVPADELLGETLSYHRYVYQDGEAAFVFRTDKSNQFSIHSPYVLDCKTYGGYSGYRTGCMFKVGLYDGEGQMLDSFEMFLGEWNNQCTVVGTFDCDVMSQPVGQQKKAKKIFNHLKSSDGYVRFVTNSYSHGRFDLRVYPIKVTE